jgi:hypothetical protein
MDKREKEKIKTGGNNQIKQDGTIKKKNVR